MAGKKRAKNTRAAANKAVPQRQPGQTDLLDFIELPQFFRRWGNLGLDDEGDKFTLQMAIAADPKGAPVISGTNGIRKLRYSPPGWNLGKSGALRVLYIYFEEFGFVVLLVVYGKDEMDNISEAVKLYLNKLVKEQEHELKRMRVLALEKQTKKGRSR